MVATVPWFIDNRQLRTAVWLMAAPIVERLDRIMALVSIDDTVLQGIATTLTGDDSALATIATEVQTLVTSGQLQPDNASVQAIQGALTDIGNSVTSLNTALTPPTTTAPASPTDPTSPTAPSSPAGPTGASAPTDPTTGATGAPSS
jgi:hypothetical protein